MQKSSGVASAAAAASSITTDSGTGKSEAPTLPSAKIVVSHEGTKAAPTEGPLSIEETRVWRELRQRRPPPFQGRPSPEMIKASSVYKTDLKNFLSTLDKKKTAYVKSEDKKITKAQKAKKRAPRPLDLLPFQRGKSKLAIDIGRVICTADTDKPSADASKSDPIGTFRVSDECIAAVRALTTHFGPENTFLLSKCGTKMQQASVIMLGANNFFQRTGILPTHALFCFKRGGVLPAGSALNMKPMEMPDDGLDPCSPQAVGFGKAQVTVDQTIGKGAVAAGFELTHLIDDRAECLKNFFEEGYLATLSKPSEHGGLMNFGAKAVGCKTNQIQKIWRRCGGTPAEAWTHVLNCFGLGPGAAAKVSQAERNAKRDAARAKREAKLEAQKKKEREKQLKQKRQQAVSKVKSNKVTYEAIATWLQISCKHLTTESDPTFALTLPPWLARRDEFMERMEADDNMMLDVFELEKFLVAAVKELGVAYFGSDFEFDPLFSEVKSIVESDHRIGQRDGLPPWIRCASDLLSPDEMELACTAIDVGGGDGDGDGDDQSWDSTEGSDSDSGSGSSSDSDSD